MNEYLIAHQEFSPSTAILGLAPYLRSTSGAQPVEGVRTLKRQLTGSVATVPPEVQGATA